MRRPNKVALISASYPPHGTGGIETQTADLAHALSTEGVDVTVFCGGTNTPTLTKENTHLKTLRMPMANLPPRVVWFQMQNLHAFEKLLPCFDIVHTQHSSCSIYGFLKRKIGKPWIVSFHDHQFTRLKVFFDVKPWNLSLGDMGYYILGYPIFDILTRIELRYADHYIACGKFGFEDYVNISKMKPEKTTIIPNGIDLSKINSILNSIKGHESSESRNDFVIFTCGRFYASKGIQYLIRAMPSVLQRFRNVKLKIFGKGPLRSYLETLINSLNLQKSVAIEGHVPYEKLIYEMSNSDIAVFPSLVEVGASLAVMEAMACGKAVVAFRYPFSTEIIQHMKTGYHVPPKDIKGLAEGIETLIEDEPLRRRISENGRNNLIKNHDMRLIARKYIDVYSRFFA
jgi:glycosyltransferase involved in cell wall biosynthesis